MTDDVKAQIREDVRNLKKGFILEAASELFVTVGYAKTKVDDIAAKCGVTKPFIYYHFDSKNEILCEICTRATGDAFIAIEGIESGDEPVDRKFDRFVRTFSEKALRNHSFVELYYRDAVHLPEPVAETIFDMRLKIEEMLVGIIRQGKEEQVFHVDDLRMTARAVLSMASFSFAWYGRARNTDIENTVTRMVAIANKLVS